MENRSKNNEQPAVRPISIPQKNKVLLLPRRLNTTLPKKTLKSKIISILCKSQNK